MSNITKKIVAVATVLTLSVMVVPSAQGQTIEELQALINSLTAQIATLTAQIAALSGGSTVTVAGCDEFDRDLSMGMTGDFDVAIEEGATIVRIGTAIFGARG